MQILIFLNIYFIFKGEKMGSVIKLLKIYVSINLIMRIVVGVIIGVIAGVIASKTSFGSSIVQFFSLLGGLFIGFLRAIAPLLVFILIASSILLKELNNIVGLKKVIILYLIGTFLAACVGVLATFLFPVSIHIVDIQAANSSAPESLGTVLKNLLFNIADNPVKAIVNGNYIGILAWAIAFGIALRFCSQETKNIFSDLSEAITKIVKCIIQFAPFGVMGLVCVSVYETGSQGLISYGKVLLLLVGAMLFLALVINPVITWFCLRKNPFPLVFQCYKESGVTAFFTRSSAANIPINLNLCKKMGLNEEIYSISIPLGATINMGGAAVVIAVLALCTAHTLGIEVNLLNAILLCLVATIGACGASGVAGGSLMLIPLACSLFNIPQDIALQIVAVGFTIGVVQDSLETAINSSTDVLFTAIASYKH